MSIHTFDLLMCWCIYYWGWVYNCC